MLCISMPFKNEFSMFMVTILSKIFIIIILFYMISFEFIYMHDMSKLINALCKII
jgi:hypothetical protein